MHVLNNQLKLVTDKATDFIYMQFKFFRVHSLRSHLNNNKIDHESNLEHCMCEAISKIK